MVLRIMNKSLKTILIFLCVGAMPFVHAQDMAYAQPSDPDRVLIPLSKVENGGNTENKIAKTTIDSLAKIANKSRAKGDYATARGMYNRITSVHRQDVDLWIAAIKNELFAKNYATALGLQHKALYYHEGNKTLLRLQKRTIKKITKAQKHQKNGDTETVAYDNGNEDIEAVANDPRSEEEVPLETALDTVAKEKVLLNKFGILNSFQIFDQVYEPMTLSSFFYERETQAGLLIPRINYSNRFEQQGLQYEIDFYPKFSKRFYAYLNYGYSNASIFPNHRVGGDLYANLPKAYELSAGGRYLSFADTDVTVITGSLGKYQGNYYFSLRSYITPQPNNLTQVSGNLVARKYYRDGENYLGMTFGMGYAPELQQLRSGDELLAETLLYVASQRIGLEYQFTPKSGQHIYRADLGVARQELTFDSGNYFWSVSAGITYRVKF